MITRSIGKVLRGNATPFQLVAACTLGGLLGFAPPLLQAPALYLILLALLLVTNANIGLTLLFAGLARLAALLLVPLSFRIGRVLLEGPTAGLFEVAVNAPILAWCGLEYFATPGGLLLGAVVGLLSGIALARGVHAFRRRMVAAAAQPGKLSAVAQKPLARFGIWLLFGKAAKGTWEEKLAARGGSPIRVWGAALLVLLLVGFYFGQRPLASYLAKGGMQTGLERANGATVDLGGVELDLDEGSLAVSALAVADPSALELDLFRADRLEADVDQADFLRRRFHIAKLVVKEASSGAPRATPGKRLAPAPASAEAPAGTSPEPGKGKGKGKGKYSIEEVLADYELWKQRLAQARGLLEDLAPLKPGAEEAGAEGDETLAERLRREVREKGWFGVKASDLVEHAPTLRLSELTIDGLAVSALPDRVFDLSGSELSTQPWLLDAPPRLRLRSRDGAIGFNVNLAPASKAGGDGALRFHWTGLPVDAVMAQLKFAGKAPLSGGTLDLALDGAWDGGRIGWVNLPLKVTFHDTTLAIKGLQPTSLDSLALSIGLSGPIDSLRIDFDESSLTKALAAAGKQELARQLESRLSEELGVDVPLDTEGVTGELEKAAAEQAKGALKGLRRKKP